MNGLLACVLSFVAAAFLGGPLIARLKRLSLAQHAYEDAPATHQGKTGTPTMGGVLFAVAIVVALALRADATTLALAVVTLACGAIGAIDDLASIRKARNRGLTARVKFGATIAAAAIFLVIVVAAHAVPPGLLAFPHAAIPLWAWLLVSLFVVLATTHAVNLTDGLDGLAGGTMLPPLVVCAAYAFMHHAEGVFVFDAALAGAVGGFLVHNRHPARMFMGDTGALALGAALAGSTILLGLQLLLPLLGAVFAAEALSVILQVASYKTRRKRIFRMSPLHHHFELGGLAETAVTRNFWIASGLCGVLSALAIGMK